MKRSRKSIDLTTTASIRPQNCGGVGSCGQPTAGQYSAIIARYAAAEGVPVSLAKAVIKIESNYRPNIVGSAGEIGLMQIKPATARMMGYTGSVKGLFDPDTNIRYGMKYLGHGAGARRRHDLRHDPEIQCRPCRQADEPGVGRLLRQGEGADGRAWHTCVTVQA